MDCWKAAEPKDDKIIEENNMDIIIINKANTTVDNIKFYNVGNFTIYALTKVDG